MNENAQDVRFHSKVAKKENKQVHFEDRNEGFCSKVYDDSKENEKVGPKSVCRAVRSHVSVDTQTGEQMHETELPLCYTGILFPRVGSQRQIVVQRDYGAVHSLASWDSLNWWDFTCADEEKMMEFVDGKNANIPLVDIQVDCEFVSGTIRCGYFYTVPRGIDLILGNDIVTVEEPLEGYVRTAEVKGSVEKGIGAVNVRSIVVGTGVEIKEIDEMKTNADNVEMFSLSTEEECLSDLDLGDLNGMFDESNESVHVINNSVSYDDLTDRQSDESYQMYDNECNMVVNEGVWARLCDCEGCSERFEESIERTDVSNDSVSCLDLTDKQSEEISLNECNRIVNEDNCTRLLADVNTNVGLDMCECEECDERFEMQSPESEWQHGVVSLVHKTVGDVSCKQELEEMCLHVASNELEEVVESPVEIVNKDVCRNVEREMFFDMVKSRLEALTWMLLRSISVRQFRLCCVDVCFGWKDDTLRMKGWLSEQMVLDVGQLQIDDFVVKLCENMLDVVGHVQMDEYVEKVDVNLWKDLKCVVETQEESLRLSSLNVTSETEDNDVSHVFSVVEQVHDKDKAMLSVESVMTTVVIANISSVSYGSYTSSNVALVCMDVDFGEKVVLVRKMVLLSNVVKAEDGSNEDVTGSS